MRSPTILRKYFPCFGLESDSEAEDPQPAAAGGGEKRSQSAKVGEPLEILYDPGAPDIDIVAIHGLGGDPYKTWTATNRNNEPQFWLKDFLPHDLPKARIMTYGYESDFGFTRSKSGIRDFALQLLSRMRTLRLGGAEKALILANEIPLYSNILESTWGIVFMGTPHLGSAIAGKGNVMLAILKSVVSVGGFGANVENKLVKGLKSNSQELWEITTSFTHRAGKIKEIVTYVEQCVVPGMTDLVVDERSAILNLPNERPMIMRADHMNMCKFARNTEGGYIELRDKLKEICGNAIRPQEEEIRDERHMMQYQNERYKQCLESLGVNTDDHRILVPNSDAETCSWILSNIEFMQWESSGGSSCLFLWAGPGAGKSVMSGFLVRNFEQKPEAERPLVASFFYSFDGEISVPHSIRQILYQIIQQDPTLLNHTTTSIENFSKGCWDGPTEGPLWKFLGVVLGAITKPLFIIIDGIDLLAAKSRRKLLDELIASVQKERKSKLKVLITGRQLREVELRAEQTPEMRHLPMGKEQIQQDIRNFATKKIKEFEKRSGREFLPEDREEIKDSMLRGAGSMFLWASLAWSTFSGASGPGEVGTWGPGDWEPGAIKNRLKRLGGIPQELNSLYSRLAGSVGAGRQQYAKRILGCLLAASRPLKIGELRTLVFYNDPGATPEFVRQQLKDICGEFISIQQDDTVRLMHQTVAEFLMPGAAKGWPNSSEPLKPREWYNFERAAVHQELGVSCLTYLTTIWKPEGMLKPDDSAANKFANKFAQHRLECKRALREAFGANPLLEYASLNWAYHLREAALARRELGLLPLLISSPGSPLAPELPELTMFMNSGPALDCSFQIYWLFKGRGVFPGDMTPLHILSYFGFSGFIRDVDTVSPKHVHATDGLGWTPLHWASKNGEHEAVRELLKINGEVNSVGEEGTLSPLHLAADRGHKEVAEVLLLNGANPDITNEEFGTPLQAAAYSGHEEVVVLLLDQNADVNAQAGELGSALQAAAYGGHLAIVKELLKRKADVNAEPYSKSIKFHSPLQAALGQTSATKFSTGDENEILALLLEAGADINAQRGRYMDALQLAATHGKTEAVEMLLAKGAVVTARGGNSGSALQAAALGGHSGVIDLLLGTPALISAQSDILSRAQKMAVDDGYSEVAHSLQLIMESTTGVAVRRRQTDLEVTRERANSLEAMSKLEVWIFKKALKRGNWKEANTMVQAALSAFKKAIRNRNSALVKRLAEFGSGALKASIAQRDTDMVQEFLKLGILLEREAFLEFRNCRKESDKVKLRSIIRSLSTSAMVTLEEAIEGPEGVSETALKTVLEMAVAEFEANLDGADDEYLGNSIRAEKRKDAEVFPQVVVECLSSAILSECHVMVDCGARVFIGGLHTALEKSTGKRAALIEDLLMLRTEDLKAAIDLGRDDEAMALRQVWTAFLLIAVEMEDKCLEGIITRAMVHALEEAIAEGPTSTEIVKSLITSGASSLRAADHAPAGDDAMGNALSRAGLAILLAAIRGGCIPLVDTISGSFAIALHSASTGDGHTRVQKLICDRAEEFTAAIENNTEEALKLAEAGLAVLSAVVGPCSTIDATEGGKLVDAISRIWSKSLNLAIERGKKDIVQNIMDEWAKKSGKELGGGDIGKVTTFSEVTIELMVVSAREGREELVRIFTSMWLGTWSSAAIEVNAQVVKGMLRPVTEAFKLAIGAPDAGVARCMLRIGLSSLVESIEKKPTHIATYIAMTWVPILDVVPAGVERGNRVCRDTALREAVKEMGASGGARGGAGTPEAFLVLLLAALARNMAGLMTFIHKTWGESFDTVDQGAYGDRLRKVAGEFKQMAKSETGAYDLNAATRNGKFGAAAKRLVQRRYHMPRGLTLSQFQGSALDLR